MIQSLKGMWLWCVLPIERTLVFRKHQRILFIWTPCVKRRSNPTVNKSYCWLLLPPGGHFYLCLIHFDNIQFSPSLLKIILMLLLLLWPLWQCIHVYRWVHTLVTYSYMMCVGNVGLVRLKPAGSLGQQRSMDKHQGQTSWSHTCKVELLSSCPESQTFLKF